MALPTPVNSQITDSVTQANVKVIADSPALSLSNMYQMVYNDPLKSDQLYKERFTSK